MSKVSIQTISLKSMPKILCQIEVAQEMSKKEALGKVCLKDVEQLAQVAQKISVSQSLPKTTGTSGTEKPVSARLPVVPCRSIEYPPTFLCVKRDKGVRGISIILSGTSGSRFQDAYRFLRQKTSILPAWAKRRCRRQAIAIFDQFWKAGEEAFFGQLRNAVKDWKKMPWNSLPADLPRKAGETSDQWLNRCYQVAGFVKMKNMKGGAI